MPSTPSGDPSVRPITRRDFLNGVALGTGALGALPARAAAQSLSGPGGFEGQGLEAAAASHALRDGAPRPRFSRGDETVDLVVVGAGISGLAAAWLYRRHAARPVRILLLEALSHVGGHALRNEFVAGNGRRIIGYGGSEALDSPSLWSPAAHSLIRGIGIDLRQFESWYDHGFRERHGLLQSAQYCAPEVWGRGALVRHAAQAAPADWIGQTPLAGPARLDLQKLIESPPDPFAALPPRAKRQRLAEVTYDELLTREMGLHPELTRWFRNRTCAYLGVGTDASSALDAWALGLPGFEAMDLGDATDALMSPSGRQAHAGRDDYIYHFPDGNAGVVRALLRSLIPDSVPGTGMEALVLARLDESRLDEPGAAVRIRRRSTVLQVRHAGDPQHAKAVDVGYVDASGTARSVRARHVVMACFHRAIPRLCPELSVAQGEALGDQVKVPLIYGNVLLRHWRPFAEAGIGGFGLPGHFWDSVRLDMPVSVGRYRFAETPDDPVLLHLGAVVLDGPPGSSAREQAAAGRRKLLGTTFGEFETGIRQLLQGALGEFGFDGGRDIEAITLNRWAHGYAYEYMRPWDAYWPSGPLPIHQARCGLGRIAIANADAGAYAYVQGAIDQATRAVGELLPQARLPRWWREPGPAPRLLKLAR